MASFPCQFHATNIPSDPFFHTGIMPHQQPMDPTPYHPSNSTNSSAAECEEEVGVGIVAQTKNCRKQRSFLDSAPPTAFAEEKKRGKESKRRRRLTEVEDNPSGFVHVRARRGQQAMDSHSLAERMRRERINERMKMLQELVPGCEKVNGRALMLDEIINYIQSLKHQVEFLSKTIASLSPIIYGFGLHLGNHYLAEPQKLDGRVATAVFSEQGTHHTQPYGYAGAVNNYSISATSAPFLQQEQQTTIYDI